MDWGALGIVLWRAFKLVLTGAAGMAVASLAITYLGVYSLLLIPAALLFGILKMEYKAEVLKRGGRRESSWDSDR